MKSDLREEYIVQMIARLMLLCCSVVVVVV